jgi:Zn-finger nucleic acid-binding protein
VTIDVCVRDEVFWFDAGELETVPAHVDASPPTATEAAQLDEVVEEFGDALDAGWDAKERATLTGRLSARLLAPHTA